MIKIVTGWSNPGGSTTAFINLCNSLNSNGYECKLFGPHQWHLNKCNAGPVSEANVQTDDILISHFCQLKITHVPKIHVLSLHEQEMFPLTKVNIDDYTKIHFVSEKQRKWHNTTKDGFVCPNIVDELKKTKLPRMPVAGIIGSIDRNKRPDISIRRAIDDGIQDIRLFGLITDRTYLEQTLLPYVNEVNKFVEIKYMKFVDNKQEIYDQISDVYLSSTSESWSYLKKECEMTGRKFHGSNAVLGNHALDLTNAEILKVWKKELVL